ncbi:YebC/PmpR family DNA-binding transcriptional regulator [Butyricicoccus sp.]|uniref:YebC/PmpR family DNA-binding transcriptional regulator n=1 Tax=Butyricicoccus sp. TaxID=2049021 RepID=UPI003F17A64A
MLNVAFKLCQTSANQSLFGKTQFIFLYVCSIDFHVKKSSFFIVSVEFAQAEIQMVPSNTITLENPDDMASMRKLLDALEDNDDVQHVWYNWENEDEYEG